MPQAAVNRVTYRTIKETTPGTTPASPVFKSHRWNQGGPTANPQFVESGEVISDRMTNDIVYVGKEIGGDVGAELAFEAFPDQIDSALCAARSVTAYREGTQITAASATPATSYTVTNVAAQKAFAQYQLIKATGFAQAANNRIFAAATGSNSTTVAAAAGGAAETPGVNARLKVIGIEGASADITATASGLSATTLNFTTVGCFYVGQWVKIGGNVVSKQFGTAANNGWARISAVGTTTMTFDILPTGWAVDAGAGKLIRIYTGDFIQNGTSIVTFTVEREFADIARYDYHAGVAVNTFGISMGTKAIVTAQFGYIGLTYTPPAAARFASATSRDGQTAPLCNTSSHIAQMRLGGVVVAGPNYISQLSFNLSNNLEALPYVGSDAYIGYNMGEQKFEGSLQCYFGDEALLTAVYAGTTFSLDLVVAGDDGSGNKYGFVIDIPKVKYAGGNPEVGAKNAVITQTLPIRALRAEPVVGGTKYHLSLTMFESVGA